MAGIHNKKNITSFKLPGLQRLEFCKTKEKLLIELLFRDLNRNPQITPSKINSPNKHINKKFSCMAKIKLLSFIALESGTPLAESDNGVVVQLVSTSACQAEGRGFKSRRPRKLSKAITATSVMAFFIARLPMDDCHKIVTGGRRYESAQTCPWGDKLYLNAEI